MLEPRRESGLVDEHADEVRIGSELRQHALDHQNLDEALQASLHGEEHLGHAPDRNLAHDEVLAEDLAHQIAIPDLFGAGSKQVADRDLGIGQLC